MQIQAQHPLVEHTAGEVRTEGQGSKTEKSLCQEHPAQEGGNTVPGGTVVATPVLTLPSEHQRRIQEW